MNTENRRNTTEKELWKLEKACFTVLYRANYEESKLTAPAFGSRATRS